MLKVVSLGFVFIAGSFFIWGTCGGRRALLRVFYCKHNDAFLVFRKVVPCNCVLPLVDVNLCISSCICVFLYIVLFPRELSNVQGRDIK